MRNLSTLQPINWMVMGDYNEIADLSEKQGGGGKPRGQMEAIQKVLMDCELSDLGFREPKYTWSSYREDGTFIQERLDRVVANQEWCAIFPFADVSIEAVVCLDHNPIFINLDNREMRRYRKRGFIYDATWGKEDAYNGIIKRVWRKKGILPDTWQSCSAKLKDCQIGQSWWQKEYKGIVERRIVENTKLLREVQGREEEMDVGQMKILQEELLSLMDQEEQTWGQKSKELWLKEGDRNTKVFFMQV